MPTYELIAIARTHATDYAPLRSLLTETGKFVMDKGGAVRDYNYWGRRTLPQRPTRKGMRHHTEGEYWTMHFDCNPPTLFELNSKMRIDPRIIRWTVLKHGSNFKAATELFDRADGPKRTYDTRDYHLHDALVHSNPEDPTSPLKLALEDAKGTKGQLDLETDTAAAVERRYPERVKRNETLQTIGA